METNKISVLEIPLLSHLMSKTNQTDAESLAHLNQMIVCLLENYGQQFVYTSLLLALVMNNNFKDAQDIIDKSLHEKKLDMDVFRRAVVHMNSNPLVHVHYKNIFNIFKLKQIDRDQLKQIKLILKQQEK
jgi:hypothetical protein